MKNEQLYYKTVDVLLDAYTTKELEHGYCSKCAVGNICKEVGKELGINNNIWQTLFYTTKQGQIIRDNHLELKRDAIKLINHTGYTIKELAKIEFAFENSLYESEEGYIYYTEDKPKEGQYIGLCAVLKVLEEIHQVKEEVYTESINKLTTIRNKFLVNI